VVLKYKLMKGRIPNIETSVKHSMLWGEGGIDRSRQKWRELLHGLPSMAFIQSVGYIMDTFSVISVVSCFH